MVATEVTVVEAEEARVTTGGHPEGVTTNPAGATTIVGPVGGLVTGPALSEVMLAVKLAVEAEVVGKPEVPGIAVGEATAEVGVGTVEAVGVAVMTAVGEVAVVRGLRGVAPGAEVGVAGIIQTTMVTRMNVLMVMEIIMTTSAPQRVRLPQMPRLPLPLP